MNSLDEVFKTWQDATLETWSFAAKQMTGSESWFNAMNAHMDVYLAGMKKMRGAVAASLEALDLPKKDDLVRLSAQVLAAETRTADCEERLDRTEAQLRATRDQLRVSEERIAKLEVTVAALQRRVAEPRPVEQTEEKTVWVPPGAAEQTAKPAEKPMSAHPKSRTIKSRRK